MAKVEAKSNPIIVDRNAGASDGATTISYVKYDEEVLWIRPPGQPWDAPNPFVLTGIATAKTSGMFVVTLSPGEIFDVAIFRENQVPIDKQVVQTRALAFLKMFCLWKEPEERHLITDENQASGGTWHAHQIHTNVATSIVRIGASRTPAMFDSNGLPHLVDPDGGMVSSWEFSNDHQVELAPLLAGNHYYFVALVADLLGNWEVMAREFDTKHRQITVSFDTLHIYNDGDWATVGTAQFWFRVQHMKGVGQPKNIEEFHKPEADIDDWGETDRPYALGARYVHNGLSMRVHDGEQEIWVGSWALEEDDPFGSDGAGDLIGSPLGLPFGMTKEVVAGVPFHIDCGPSTDGSSFHYGVDGTWSVTYVL